MWSLGTHENLLWPLFFVGFLNFFFLSASCAIVEFGRGINSSSLSTAEEPSSDFDCKYGDFQNRLRQKTQQSVHKVACTGGRKTTPKDFTGV